MYILGMVILVFFAVIGIAVFIGTLAKAHLKNDTDGLILLIPQLNADNAEARIRSAAVIRQETQGCRVVCICEGDNDAMMICEKMKREYPFLEVTDRFEVINTA